MTVSCLSPQGRPGGPLPQRPSHQSSSRVHHRSRAEVSAHTQLYSLNLGPTLPHSSPLSSGEKPPMMPWCSTQRMLGNLWTLCQRTGTVRTVVHAVRVCVIPNSVLA